MTNVEARFNKSLRPRKPEGSLGRTAQDVHLDSHTAPELYDSNKTTVKAINTDPDDLVVQTARTLAAWHAPGSVTVLTARTADRT